MKEYILVFYFLFFFFLFLYMLLTSVTLISNRSDIHLSIEYSVLREHCTQRYKNMVTVSVRFRVVLASCWHVSLYLSLICCSSALVSCIGTMLFVTCISSPSHTHKHTHANTHTHTCTHIHTHMHTHTHTHTHTNTHTFRKQPSLNL